MSDTSCVEHTNLQSATLNSTSQCACDAPLNCLVVSRSLHLQCREGRKKLAAPASAHIRAWERANARTGTTAAMRVAQALALLALLVAAAARTDPSAEVRRAPGGSSLCQIYKAACPSFPCAPSYPTSGTLQFA